MMPMMLLRAHKVSGDSFDVECWRAGEPGRSEFEEELLERGAPIPLRHRELWARAHREQDSWYLGVRDAAGSARYGASVELGRSRALPGHRILRVAKFGYPAVPGATRAALAGLAQLALREPRVLRLHVESFHPEPSARQALAQNAAELGFRRAPVSRGYVLTIILPLELPEDELLLSLPRYTRKNIRRTGKEAFEVKTVGEAALEGRLDQLLRETLSRSGGDVPAVNWRAAIALSDREPSLSRLVGLFRTDLSGPEALVAFGWACSNGDHVEYLASASTRIQGSRLPLGYAVAWDLIRWARSIGARWFDFGGVTGSGPEGEDPLKGISEFKMQFSRNLVEVGGEWVLEPSRWKSALARTIGAGRSWTERILR